jgi:hypothetical protein
MLFDVAKIDGLKNVEGLEVGKNARNVVLRPDVLRLGHADVRNDWLQREKIA